MVKFYLQKVKKLLDADLGIAVALPFQVVVVEYLVRLRVVDCESS